MKPFTLCPHKAQKPQNPMRAGVAGGATRAALTQHFARQGNAADVAAREASQETATTLLGGLGFLGFWVLFRVRVFRFLGVKKGA